MGGKYLETYECLSWFRKRHLYALMLEQRLVYVDKNTIPYKSRDI